MPIKLEGYSSLFRMYVRPVKSEEPHQKEDKRAVGNDVRHECH